MMSRNTFNRWLFETQVEPAFLAHPFLLRAKALVVPRLWAIEDASQPTYLMIFYSAHETLDLDGAIGALAENGQDPNLPAGVSIYDLYQPVLREAWQPGARPLPFTFHPRSWFLDTPIDPDSGTYGVLDAFAVYASFYRRDGVTVTKLHDERMSESIDSMMARLSEPKG